MADPMLFFPYSHAQHTYTLALNAKLVFSSLTARNFSYCPGKSTFSVL